MVTRIFGQYYTHDYAPFYGINEQGIQAYTETIGFYYEFYMGQAPSDIWETPEAKGFMCTLDFRFVNLYRMATMYVMKAKAPDMLKKKAKKIPDEEKVLKPEWKLEIEKPSAEEIQQIEDDPEKQ